MEGHVRPPIVSVIGTSTPSDTLYGLALELGRLLARQGITIVCGGRGGVMEAVCRGAAEEGGLSVGLLPHSLEEANDWVTLPLVTGLGEGRNLAVALSGQVVVAIGGAYGTLSEIGFALRAGKPVIALKTWHVADEEGNPAPLHHAQAPREAAEIVRRLLFQGGERT